MANPVYVTYTTTGAQTAIGLDYRQTPFNVSVGVYLASTGTYAVQYTFDPIDDATVTPRWFDDANLPTGTAATGVSNYMFPVRAIRLNIAANGSSIEFKVMQGMPTG